MFHAPWASPDPLFILERIQWDCKGTMGCGIAGASSPLNIKTAPGPRGHWLSGNLPEFRSGGLAFLTQCARVHGDAVALRFAHRRVLLLSHPDLIEEVLVT